MRGTETILLVDDEETVIDVATESCWRGSVTGFYGQKPAGRPLILYKAKTDEIALVILDMIMPGDGRRGDL